MLHRQEQLSLTKHIKSIQMGLVTVTPVTVTQYSYTDSFPQNESFYTGTFPQNESQVFGDSFDVPEGVTTSGEVIINKYLPN